MSAAAERDERGGAVYTGVGNLEAMAAATRYNRFLVESALRAGHGATHVLDFGAGTGEFAAALAERGLDVVCVEPDAALRVRLAARGLRAEASPAAIADASCDLVCIVNVLEHIDDDAATLRELRTKLRPGGRLFVYVPAFQLLFSSMDRRVGHRRRYSRAQLRAVAERAGLGVETLRYADVLGFFAALLYKWRSDASGDLSPFSVRLYDRCVFPASRALDGLGCGRLFGKNLVAVLRRSGGS